MGRKCLHDCSKVSLIETRRRGVTHFLPLVEFSLYLLSFSTSRKNQLAGTLPTLLHHSGLLSTVVLLEIFKKCKVVGGCVNREQAFSFIPVAEFSILLKL